MSSYGQQFKIREVPPIVQELVAEGVQEPPGQYVVPEQDRPAAAFSEMPEPIPVVDLSRLSADSPDELAKLRSALENWDLFLAVGHGMEPGFLAEAMKVMREFFKLPLEEKRKYSNIVDGKKMSWDGYGNDLVVVENQVLDWNDRLSLLVEPESERAYALWPTQPPSFRDILCEYTVRCRGVANLILQKLAKLLNLQEEYLTTMLGEKSLTQATINYYPRCPKPDHVLGLKPHTDSSLITVNFVDVDVSGLQLQKNGIWYNVPIVANALVVNMGDLMEVVSNGFFKSLMHRVVTNAEKERLSLVMFYVLDPEAEIEPVPELVDDKRPRRYKNMKTKDYLAKFFDTYATGKLAIDSMKI
ncbi:protein SRG1-like [Hordeum vulgare subsp. vulgare]|uniref:Fe2OG dioxygenase domain-containing protein n=1 Tax=Hordeum vulgare subsp. vulgare TaxID=112509 RepID=A0A8I6YNT4_HORVV|nr:protein SRG1-like [Hordeum vulgare subsp. vulgare]